jgi:bifunctional non-homologous end joining protein LigD
MIRIAAQLLQAACALKLEGIMLKRADSPYVYGRTDTWLKLKCSLREAFVVWALPIAAVRGEGQSAVATRTSVKASNPERVIDASTGLAKLDLFRFYESVADWILPHLKDRPVCLVRAPDGIEGQLFFQKHPESRMPGLTILDARIWPGHTALLSVDDVDGLLSAAKMNIIEFHTWNSTVDDINHPDRVVFDLNPGEGVTWSHLQEAALLTRTMLEELQLKSWLKTSGGKDCMCGRTA